MSFYQSVSDDLNVFKEHPKGLNLPHKIPVEVRLHLSTLACFWQRCLLDVPSQCAVNNFLPFDSVHCKTVRTATASICLKYDFAKSCCHAMQASFYLQVPPLFQLASASEALLKIVRRQCCERWRLVNTARKAPQRSNAARFLCVYLCCRREEACWSYVLWQWQGYGARLRCSYKSLQCAVIALSIA